VLYFAQLDLWAYQSVPMIVPSLFVITRWQSKYKMIWSLLQNKDIVIALCESEDEECKSLHEPNVALTAEEWLLIEVCLLLISLFVLPFYILRFIRLGIYSCFQEAI